MTCISITEFGGINKQLSPRNRERVHAQIAHNCLLSDGSLRPMPAWVKFSVLPAGTFSEDNYLYENKKVNFVAAALEFRDSIYLTGAPFADNVLVGVDKSTHALVFGINSNVYAAQNGDSQNALRPIGLPTPSFGDYITASSVSYVAQHHSIKPVNRIIGLTFCRLTPTGLEESPIALLPEQSTYGVMYEGDLIQVSLTLAIPLINIAHITHIRLYRSISGLDTGEQIANELDTDWHLITTIAVRPVISFNDGGSVTTDPLDLYLAKHFYSPNIIAQHFGLTESGWFYAADNNGKIALSERYLHHAWPTENVLMLPNPIVDVAEYYDALFIGTNANPYVVSVGPGEGEQGLQAAAVPFPERLPCLARTMVPAPGGALYVTPRGLVSLSKSGQKTITANITNPGDTLYTTTGKTAAFSRTTLGAYWEGNYFGFCQPVSREDEVIPDNELTLIGDLPNGAIFYPAPVLEAVHIVACVENYFSINDTVASETSPSTWQNPYGGTVFNYSTGPNAREGQGVIYDRAAFTNNLYAASFSFSLSLEVSLTPLGYTGKRQIGTGEDYYQSVGGRQYVEVRTAGGAMFIKLVAFDYGLFTYVYGPETPIDAGHYTFGFRFVLSTRVLTFLINGVPHSTLTLGTYVPPAALQRVFIQDSESFGGGLPAFADLPGVKISRVYTTFCALTDEEFAYLHNGGVGKTWAQILVDAFLP